MSSSRLKFILRDFGVMRLWSAWTRRHFVSTLVRRCIRDRGFREVIQVFKHTILRPRRTLFLSAAAFKSHDSYDCDQGISDDELQALLLELENVEILSKRTLYCTSCGARLVIDKKQQGVRYCMCKEPHSDSDSSDGWVPYMEAEDVIIWRKEYKEGKGLYAYKVFGRYPDVTASDFAAVQVDGAYRRSWDTAVAALAVVQRNANGVPGQAVLHWEVLWPRLFANRDYVYLRRHKEFDVKTNRSKPEEKISSISPNVHAKAKRKSLESYKSSESEIVNNKVYIIVSKSCEHPDVPETKHAIRVSEYWSHMVVKTLNGTEKPGMEFVLTYYDEPAVGGMPGGVAAWASSRAAPAYLDKMRKAAGEYRAWAAGRPAQELPDFVPFGPDQVNNEQAIQIQEQDMETSKQGPELENVVTTRDQSSQTDEYLLHNYIHKEKEIAEPQDKEVQVNISEDTLTKQTKGDGRNDKSGNGKKDASTSIEEEKEEESNGGWWRYLYPFYYFV